MYSRADVAAVVIALFAHATLALALGHTHGPLPRHSSSVEVEIAPPHKQSETTAASPPPAVDAPPSRATQKKVAMPKPVQPVPQPPIISDPEPTPDETEAATASSPSAASPADGGVGGGIAKGDPGGVPGGVKGGVAGGTAGGDAIVGPSYGADYLRNAPPKYPAIARRMNLEGTTTLRVLVSVEGHPKSVRVQMSSGVDVLDEAALEAVQHWSFVPARRGSTPVAAEVNVPVRFRLDGTTAE